MSLKVFIWKVPECFQSVGFGRFLEGSRVPVFGKSWMRHSGSQSSEGLRLPEVLKGEGSAAWTVLDVFESFGFRRGSDL